MATSSTGSGTGSGGDFLERKSHVTKLRQSLPELRDVLIVDDDPSDANRLKATLRVLFGYQLEVRLAATLASAVDSVLKKQPDLVFLDDILKPSDNASDTIPFLRHAKYAGPIVVVSGQVTRARQSSLVASGATDVIHKDDVDSVRLAEAMVRVFKG